MANVNRPWPECRAVGVGSYNADNFLRDPHNYHSNPGEVQLTGVDPAEKTSMLRKDPVGGALNLAGARSQAAQMRGAHADPVSGVDKPLVPSPSIPSPKPPTARYAEDVKRGYELQSAKPARLSIYTEHEDEIAKKRQ